MSRNLAYNEKELLLRMASDDGEALAIIYREFWQPLFLRSYNVLKDKAACEDIVQEIFLNLWEKRHTIEITSSLEAWLHTSARYQVYHFIRKGKASVAIVEKLEEKFGALTTPETDLAQKELIQRVNDVVNQLPERCQEIYRLSREAQLSHKEIAARLNISTKTVEAQLSIALRRIRGSIGELAAVAVILLY
ncbi:MAG: RNA polymerase sigma factor [Agriterribacter sp.]